MSTNYQAVTVIGIILKRSDLYYENSVRGCIHLSKVGENNFCPKCGAPAWVKQETSVAGYDTINDTLNGTPLCKISNGADDFIGVGLFRKSNSDKNAFAEITPDLLASIKDVVKEALGPLGLWHEEQFGIHTLLHIC